jgi:hypothetical protein
MKKLFISQPMRGFTDEQILQTRAEIIKEVRDKLGEDVEILESFFEGFEPIGNIPVAYLGKSISLLAEADIVYFGKGWNEARGCKIEHEIAVQYGMVILEG